jgi:hypothetical protein
MIHWIAQAGPQVDGAWVTGFVVAILGAVGTMLGYSKGRKTRTQVEPNPLPVAIVAELATKAEMREQEGRLTGEIRKLETQVHGERGVARTANSNIHARLDKMAEKDDITRLHDRIDKQALATASAAASLAEVKSNVNQLLALALNRTPKPRA